MFCSSVMADTDAKDLVLSLVNEDIRGFVSDKADAARAATMLHLATYLSVDMPSADQDQSYSERLKAAVHPSSVVNSLWADDHPEQEREAFPDRLGALDAVKDALLKDLEDAVTKKPSLPLGPTLDAICAACEKVAVQQIEYVYDASAENGDGGGGLSALMRRKLVHWIEEAMDHVGVRVPFVDRDGNDRERGDGHDARYVTSLEDHVSRCQEAVEDWGDHIRQNDKLNSSKVDELEIVPVLKHVFRPYFTMLFLRMFIRDSSDTAHIRRGHTFYPSFLDAQYAGLAVYRVVFDTLMHMRTLYRERAEDGSDQYSDAESTITVLSVMSSAVSEAMFRDHIDPSAKHMDTVFERVNTTSQDTKKLSKQLFQLSRQYEVRKHNLSVITHTREQVRERAERLRVVFVWTVAAYAVTMFVIVVLYVMKRYTYLSLFSAVVAACILVWYCVMLLMRVFSARRRSE